MLDIDVIVEPTAVATDVVSRADLRKHLRISSTNTALDDVIDAAIAEAVDKLDGPGGELNRTILPRTYKRYMKNFPGNDENGDPKPILLPFAPLLSVLAVTIEDGSSPDNNLVVNTDYIVKTGTLVPEIHPVTAWPSVEDVVRGVSVTYQAGYTTFPDKLKRMVKILAAHYVENSEATINEPRQMMINRRVEFGMDDLRAALKIPNSFDDWNE
ncbi:hypothetical protein MesoLjLc_50580 [Mesorhizobium sp. L-8-10]|uniref:head-tail connector protein n=1 Tax=Mesorhizobium sp. L-8-10 TaxID=2744523 RepID=UPI001926AFBF|nr:hypothetical protein [Mesorhizobium sp. L-8-10]BCH33128.1 hypothetical protein MesoLjLc_50580 [Mesorhizobium sp. L-8-10]